MPEPRQTHFCSFRNYLRKLSTPPTGDGHLEAGAPYTLGAYFNSYYNKLMMKATLSSTGFIQTKSKEKLQEKRQA